MAEIIDLLPAAAGFLMMLGLSLLLCSEDLADDLRDRASAAARCQTSFGDHGT
jgi:hypothetical protein